MSERATFYTDAHIHYEVVRQLRAKGVDVLRCQDVKMDNAKDHEHLSYATEQGRIMITCDRDFNDLHYLWIAEGREHAGIIYCQEPDLCTISIILGNVLLIWEEPEGKEQLRNTLWRVQK